MQLFYNQTLSGSCDPLIELTAQQSHHCLNVMRMGVGSEVHISDGAGVIYHCRIVATNAKHCTVEVIDTIRDYNKRNYRLDLAVAPTKNFDRMEWLIEKATEIGIDSFTPLLCARSERKVVKMERLERIVESAAAQSQKAYLPVVNQLTSFQEYIKTHPNGFIAHCIENSPSKIELPRSAHYTILIGPEGDFSPAELDQATEAGYRGLTLGNQRLRTETAALYATVAAALRGEGL